MEAIVNVSSFNMGNSNVAKIISREIASDSMQQNSC